ncbi:MAG: hypothetical protein LBR60_04350 [Fibrobacter sp.]|jgi:hypothetical protein|nr:hypothetical protein [Fibrobacter sp.]
MTNITRKGGKYFLQEDRKKGEENIFISLFLESEAGKKWLIKNKMTDNKPQESESPDFLFTNSQGEKIGIEITKLLNKTNKFKATARLNTIANKVVQYFKKEKNIALSVLIDVYDKRKVSPNWNDHISYCNNPGFDKIEPKNKEVEDAIIKAITKKGIPELGLKKITVTVAPHTFIVTYDNVFFSPHTSARVNNSGMCKEDPFEELQNTINSKNEKYESYKKQCQKCDLLIVSEDSSAGNFVCFSNNILNHKFDSRFENVYLLDLGSFAENRVVELRKTQPLINF